MYFFFFLINLNSPRSHACTYFGDQNPCDSTCTLEINVRTNMWPMQSQGRPPASAPSREAIPRRMQLEWGWARGAKANSKPETSAATAAPDHGLGCVLCWAVGSLLQFVTSTRQNQLPHLPGLDWFALMARIRI